MSSAPIDLGAIARAWTGEGEALRAALEPTWRDPEGFEAALFARLEASGRAPISRRGRHYDLYAELVGRHLSATSPALLHPGRGAAEWLAVRPGELHDLSGRLATEWLAAGALPGARITLVLPPGPAAVLGVLTCLRSGLVATLLPPSGRGFVRRRLAASRPDFVVVRPEDASWALDEAQARLPAMPGPGVVSEAAQRSHGYGPSDPALEVWSPMSPEPDRPLPVAAGPLFVRLATDALFVLALAPGERLAAPELDPRLHQPVLALAALFAGATWVETDVDRLESAPLSLGRVAIGEELRDRVLAGRVRLEGCRSWLVSPAETHDWAAWRAFGDLMAAQGALGQNLLPSAGFGGVLLFSPPTAHPGLDVLPALGWDWVLEEPGAPGQETTASAGLLAARDGALAPGAVGAFLLADGGARFTLGGAGLRGPRGAHLPAREMAAVAETHPAVDGAALIVQPDPRVPNAVASTLVVFVDPASDPRPAAERLEAELRRNLERDMGPAYLPDKVRAYPLAPRRDETGAVDAGWCRFQYLTGALEARSKSEIHRLSSLLRRWGEARAREAEPWPSP